MAFRVAPYSWIKSRKHSLPRFCFTQDSFYADFMDQRKEAD